MEVQDVLMKMSGVGSNDITEMPDLLDDIAERLRTWQPDDGSTETQGTATARMQESRIGMT